MPFSYEEWNQRLVDHFFNIKQNGKQVLLFVTPEVLQQLGGQQAEFIQACKTGPQGSKGAAILERSLNAHRSWRDRNSTPPYIAHLSLLVLAAGHHVDGRASHNYYARLRDLLGIGGEGTVPFYKETQALWEDLEKWSALDKQGQLGTCKFRRVGGKAYVGLPRAQTVLTQDERLALPTILTRILVDPRDPPATEAIAQELLQRGTGKLRPVTLRALQDREDPAYREFLLDAIEDEIETMQLQPVLTAAKFPIILTLHVDPHAGGRFGARIAGAQEPLIFQHGETVLECEPETYRHTTELATNFEPFNAAQLDWEHGDQLLGPQNGTLAASPVRIFCNPPHFGSSGLIETWRLPQQGAVYIAVAASHSRPVKQWLTGHSTGLRDLTGPGLPTGWNLWTAARLDKDAPEIHPALTLQRASRLKALDGIKAGQPTLYYSFAPPRFVVDGEKSAAIEINGHPAEDPPAKLNAGRYLVEAKDSDGYTFASLHVELIDCLPSDNPALKQHEHGKAHGAATSDVATPNIEFCLPPELQGSIILGNSPAHVAKEAVGWTPVWALKPRARRGKYTALFIGSRPEDCRPTVVGATTRQLRNWHELLWAQRKRIVPPNGAARQLWNQYLEAARNE